MRKTDENEDATMNYKTNWNLLLKKGSFKCRRLDFDSSACGLSSTMKNLTLETPLKLFELIFNSNLIGTIVK